MFTKQDYLDGKCTKDGKPLTGGQSEPIEETASSPEPISNIAAEEAAASTSSDAVDIELESSVDDSEEVIEEDESEEKE